MAKRIIKNGDSIFATGVFLTRDTTVNGGWVVSSFEDESFFAGKLVEHEIVETDNKTTVTYFIEQNNINQIVYWLKMLLKLKNEY